MLTLRQTTSNAYTTHLFREETDVERDCESLVAPVDSCQTETSNRTHPVRNRAKVDKQKSASCLSLERSEVRPQSVNTPDPSLDKHQIHDFKRGRNALSPPPRSSTLPDSDIFSKSGWISESHPQNFRFSEEVSVSNLREN